MFDPVLCINCTTNISLDTFLEQQKVCPECGHHFPMTAHERLELLGDRDSFTEHDSDLHSLNPLDFPDYASKLKRDTAKTGMSSEILTGTVELGNVKVALAIGDMRFMGGSMGSVIGEKLTRIIEHATENRLSLVTVSVSGGMRMQEGTLALMQMEKTAAAVARMKRSTAKTLYISIVTDPTFGGATASFVSLGDIIIAEPKARIGFAGPRAVASIREKLPNNFQRSEFLLEHGMIDFIVERKNMEKTVINLLEFCDV